MITNDYKRNKEMVLQIYEEFKATALKIGKEVNKSISRQVEDIKNEKFKLMVVGEAKSGKSTFINAYLEKEIMPMDVKQCTSSIIKISYGNEYELKAINALGGSTIIKDDEKIKNFLKDNAALKDEYRCIPVTTINNELLLKNKGKNIPNRILNEFLLGVAQDNIFNKEIEEYNDLIKKYINENSLKWGSIITEIQIKYPLSEEMKSIELIDSPGVNAGGNVGKVAENYIEEANAIIFVKSLNGQAIESSSFTNFFKITKCK